VCGAGRNKTTHDKPYTIKWDMEGSPTTNPDMSYTTRATTTEGCVHTTHVWKGNSVYNEVMPEGQAMGAAGKGGWEGKHSKAMERRTSRPEKEQKMREPSAQHKPESVCRSCVCVCGCGNQPKCVQCVFTRGKNVGKDVQCVKVVGVY